MGNEKTESHMSHMFFPNIHRTIYRYKYEYRVTHKRLVLQFQGLSFVFIE